MSAEVQRSIFRVISPHDRWVGSGFLLLVEGVESQPVFLTCAHVIADALGDRSLAENPTPPKGSFFVDFPNSGLTSKFEATVYQNDPTAWCPMMPDLNVTNPRQDLALVNIGMRRPPDGVEPVVITEFTGEIAGDTVLAYGGANASTRYSDNFPKLSEGRVQGRVGALLQIRSTDPEDKAFIERGYSGGPLWSPDSNTVLGVVTIADEKENLAWVLPSSAIREIVESAPDAKSAINGSSNTEVIPEIPIDYQPRTRELLLNRKKLADQVDEKVDEVFLLYLHGDANTGKSSEIQRLMDSPAAKVTKKRTIWQTCIKGMSFAEMADYIAEDCLKIKGEKRFGARELIRALRDKEMFLVLDGYSKEEHPTVTPLIEIAAPLEKPTHLVVTTNDSPISTDIEQCAVMIPKVNREEVISSIEALTGELTIEFAQLVDSEEYDASSAYRIVDQVKKGIPIAIGAEDPADRVTRIFNELWPRQMQELMTCLALVETYVLEELFVYLCNWYEINNPAEIRESLLSESLIRTDDPRSFTLRDYCRQAILVCSNDDDIPKCHRVLGDAFYELIAQKTFEGFDTPSIDVLDAIRAIRHYQISTTCVERRLNLLNRVKASAARKGMHRQLALVIGFEARTQDGIDPWLLIQLVQSELALGQIKEAFAVAKLAQSTILELKPTDVNLVVSLCNQFASVLSQARENTLAGHLLGVSKNLFQDSQIHRSLVPIRDSLKAWCDGKSGKIDQARRVGQRLLSQARGEQEPKRSMQIAIESTRLGVFEGDLGNYELADELLGVAVENFSRSDRRGEIWALSHQCFFQISAASTKLPIEKLERLIDLQSTTLLISEETFSHYQTFELALKGHPLHSSIEDLSAKFAARYEKMKLSDYEIEYAEAFVEKLQAKFGRKSSEATNHSQGILLSSTRNPSKDPRDESIIAEVIKDDPKEVLISLYEGVSPTELLNSLFYSRLLTSSLLKLGDEGLIDAFIETYFERIIKSRRLTRLNFAGFFERCGRPALGLKLLAGLRGENSYRFHNISANCHKTSNFEEARFHNEQALVMAGSPEEKSRIHNNLAALYLMHGRYEERETVWENLRLAKILRASHFFWPFRTELAAKLTYCDVDNYEAELEAFAHSQILSDRAIKFIASLLVEPDRKLRFLDLAPKYIPQSKS